MPNSANKSRLSGDDMAFLENLARDAGNADEIAVLEKTVKTIWSCGTTHKCARPHVVNAPFHGA